LLAVVWLLMRSPGTGAETPRGRGRAGARQNVVAFKMQTSSSAGDRLDRRTELASRRIANPGQFATNPTFFAFTIIILGGLDVKVRSSVRSSSSSSSSSTMLSGHAERLPDWLVTGRTARGFISRV
jgi:hypothetical protein